MVARIIAILILSSVISDAICFSTSSSRRLSNFVRVLPTSSSLKKIGTCEFKLASSVTDGDATKPSKCPVTKFSNHVMAWIAAVDRLITKRLLRFVQHLPVLLSLIYFGFVSSSSMIMGMNEMSSVSSKNELVSLLTKWVGPTSNVAFSQMFPSLVTPVSSIFIVWPLIAILQLLTVATSMVYPMNDEFLSSSDLSSLTIANALSTVWLFISSNAKPNALPVGCALVLPLVPYFCAYPLRNKPRYLLPAFELFSSFTTIAALLAFAIEMQHGGRIPFLGTVSQEVAASSFLFLYSTASLAVINKSLVKRLVHLAVLSGILFRRLFTGGTGLAFGIPLLSFSFWGTVGCWWWSVQELLPKKKTSDP